MRFRTSVMEEKGHLILCSLHCAASPHLTNLRHSGKNTLTCTNLCFLEVSANKRMDWPLFSHLPWACHLPGFSGTCALRIVPASSAFHRRGFGEGPATVLRAWGGKMALSQDFFSFQIQCLQRQLQSPRFSSTQSLTLTTSVLLKAGRGCSQGNQQF